MAVTGAASMLNQILEIVLPMWKDEVSSVCARHD